MAALTSGELANLRALGQRFRLYLAVWGTWQIAQSTPLLSDNSVDPPTMVGLGTKDAADFKPVVNIGPHRLAFAGEAIVFDASRSFAVQGGSVGSFAWSFPSGSSTTASGAGPHSISWATPGLYEITCSSGGQTATRWVRVLADRQTTTYDVTQVGGVGGSVDGGWKTSIEVTPSDDVAGTGSQTVAIADFQAVGLFCEEEWQQPDGSWVVAPISGYGEPTCLIEGYVEQGSIRFDAERHAVGFTLGSLADQMNLGFVHGTQSWSKEYLDVDAALAIPALPDPPQGVIFDLPPGLVMPDVILWWLQTYTNIFERHDFSTWYDTTQQELDTVSTSETSIWNAFGSLADNEWAWWFVDPQGGLHFEPNPHIRSYTWFDGEYPLRVDLGEQDLIAVDANEDKMRNVVWVQLTGTRDRDGRQWTARYPTETPPSGAGSWYMKSGLLVSRGSFLDNIVARVYRDANRRYVVTLTLGLNRSLRVPDQIHLTVEIPDRGIDWVSKRFIVQQISYGIDVAASQWVTTVTAHEWVV